MVEARFGKNPPGVIAKLRRAIARWLAAAPADFSSVARIAPGARFHPESSVQNLCGKPDQIQVGAHTHIRGELLLYWEGGEIRVGEWSYVGHGSRIWSRHAVHIGDYVLISHNVEIHDTDAHPIDWRARQQDIECVLGGRASERPAGIEGAPVTIEDRAWIGARAIILKGVCVGRGAIVGAGAVVTRDVPPFTLVAGNPARVIRSLPE